MHFANGLRNFNKKKKKTLAKIKNTLLKLRAKTNKIQNPQKLDFEFTSRAI